MSLLGLDIGMTGCKAVLFDVEGGIKAQAYREYPLLQPEPGWGETDPQIVWQSIVSVIQQVTSQSGGDPVRALAASCMGVAVTPVNLAGEYLYNTMNGLDLRIIREWEQELGARRVYQVTGQPIHPMYSVNKILWLRQYRPEIYRQTWKFLNWEELFFLKLGLEPATDYSLAATTQLFDIHRKIWAQEVLEQTQIDPDRLAIPLPAGTVVGEVGSAAAEELGLPKGVIAATGGHDQPCCALGGGVVEEGITVDSTGTVECITPAHGRPILTDQMLSGNYLWEPHVKAGMYVSLAFNITGGAVLKWFRDTLSEGEQAEAAKTGADVYDLIIGRASTEPAGVLLLPHFAGSGTPWLDIDSKGALIGLTLATTKGDIIKGVLDSLTYEAKVNIDSLEGAGVEIREMRAIGGGAKSRTWMKLKADIWGKRVVSLNVTEAGCLGAAILAGTACGVYRSVEDGVQQTIKVKEVFEPDPARHQRYLERYAIYRQIYPTIKSLTHQL